MVLRFCHNFLDKLKYENLYENFKNRRITALKHLFNNYNFLYLSNLFYRLSNEASQSFFRHILMTHDSALLTKDLESYNHYRFDKLSHNLPWCDFLHLNPIACPYICSTKCRIPQILNLHFKTIVYG